MEILAYIPVPAEFQPYDPSVDEIAQRLRDEIRRIEPRLEVEQVGSTSVPGCGGKGIVDLAVLYPNDLLAIAKAILDALGFQRQTGPEPWPEERPMRIGCVGHNERFYRIHAHVLALDCDEHRELIWFRDLLHHDPLIRQRYETQKQEILAMGINNSLEYCKAKGIFIETALKQRTSTK